MAAVFVARRLLVPQEGRLNAHDYTSRLTVRRRAGNSPRRHSGGKVSPPRSHEKQSHASAQKQLPAHSVLDSFLCECRKLASRGEISREELAVVSAKGKGRSPSAAAVPHRYGGNCSEEDAQFGEPGRHSFCSRKCAVSTPECSACSSLTKFVAAAHFVIASRLSLFASSSNGCPGNSTWRFLVRESIHLCKYSALSWHSSPQRQFAALRQLCVP